MWSNALPSVLTGFFTVIAAFGGIVINNRMLVASERLRIAADDNRLWLADRRKAYVRFLTTCEDMLRDLDQIDRINSSIEDVFPGTENEALAREELVMYLGKWEDVLQPRLLEVRLVANFEVDDLASRMSGALFAAPSIADEDEVLDQPDPERLQARELLYKLRTAMRQELGLAPPIISARQLQLSRSSNQYTSVISVS
jgi:hypothetical protein